MQVLHDFQRPYVIESLSSPLMIKHCWMFSAPLCDYVMSPIVYLEETTGPSVKIRVNNTEFWVPKSWYVLVTEKERFTLDTVQVHKCSTIPFDLVTFCPNEMKLRTLTARVIDYAESMSLVHPMISKGTALCHPVGPAPTMVHGKELQLSIVIGPFDLEKHLREKVVGDLF